MKSDPFQIDNVINNYNKKKLFFEKKEIKRA